MVNVSAFDNPPPGAGFDTATCAEPAVAMSLAGIEVAKTVLLTNVAAREVLFQMTCEPTKKFDPVNVRLRAGPPATALAGEIEVSTGAGLLVPEGWIVNVSVLERPPPGAGLSTVTGADPGAGTSEAGMMADKSVLLRTVVARAFPFHWATEAGVKFDPMIPRVKLPAPAGALDGESALRIGSGLGSLILTMKASSHSYVFGAVPQVPPP